MSAGVRAQLAAVLERVVAAALAEVTEIVERDSALLRAEVSRRQREVEALLDKLRYVEAELRAARREASARAPARRSLCVRVSHASIPQEDTEGHSDRLLVPSASVKENGTELCHIKEEQMELTAWENEDDVEETRDCWDKEGPSLHASGCEEAKPDVVWDSPDLEDVAVNSARTPKTSREPFGASQEPFGASREPPGASQEPFSALQEPPGASQEPFGASREPPDAHPGEGNQRQDLPDQYQRPTDCSGPARAHPGDPAAPPHPVGEHRAEGAGDKSSRCAQCGKTFTTRFYLKIHQRIHTGERPYTCLQCGKRFYCNSHLISHQRCHTGEKPYSCEECGKSYSHLNSLKLHQRSHTEDELAYSYW